MHLRFVLPALAVLVALVSATGSTGTETGAVPSREKLQLAIEAQLQLLEQSPGDAGLLSDLGNLLALAGRYEAAETAYRDALARTPDDVGAHYNLALLLEARGREGEAVEHHRRVIELDPGAAWSHYQLGRFYEQRGEKSAALAAYVRAFSLDPELAFPDVNPHVLENALATKALLLANQSDLVSRDAAPRTYRDPSRIATLLVPPAGGTGKSSEKASEKTPEKTQAGATSHERPEHSLGGSGGVTHPLAEVGDGPAAPDWEAGDVDEPLEDDTEKESSQQPRSLTSRDLDALPRANQATPEDEAPAQSAGVRMGRPRPAPPPRPPASELDDPSSGFAPDSVNPDSAAPPSPRFRPGLRSSAQLDLEFRKAPPASSANGVYHSLR